MTDKQVNEIASALLAIAASILLCGASVTPDKEDHFIDDVCGFLGFMLVIGIVNNARQMSSKPKMAKSPERESE